MCVHHWVIQDATGPTSPGVCQNCGEAKEFNNSVADNKWDNGRKENPEISKGRIAYFKNAYTPHPYTIHNSG